MAGASAIKPDESICLPVISAGAFVSGAVTGAVMLLAGAGGIMDVDTDGVTAGVADAVSGAVIGAVMLLGAADGIIEDEMDGVTVGAAAAGATLAAFTAGAAEAAVRP